MTPIEVDIYQVLGKKVDAGEMSFPAAMAKLAWMITIGLSVDKVNEILSDAAVIQREIEKEETRKRKAKGPGRYSRP